MTLLVGLKGARPGLVGDLDPLLAVHVLGLDRLAEQGQQPLLQARLAWRGQVVVVLAAAHLHTSLELRPGE